MLATYTAVDGFSIESTSTAAWLMADTAADMVVDRVTGNSPLKNLTENGTHTNSAVVSNSTTLESSGFGVGVYYSMAYDSAFDPGTSGLSIKCWFNVLNNVGTNYFIDRAQSGGGGARYSLYMFADGTLYAYVYDGSTSRFANSASAYDDGLDHYVSMTFDGDTVSLYVDGDLVDDTTGSTMNSLSNGTAILRIGLDTNLSNPMDGSLCGVEVDIGTKWTAQAVKTKYNTEKILFNQFEIFSIVGQSLQYEINLLTSSITNIVNDQSSTTLNGSVSGLTWYRKQGFECSTIPFARTSLAQAKKFLRSTNNVTFTFDERGSLSNSPIADNPITVYKTSGNEQIAFLNPYYQFSFSLREA